MFPEFGNSCEQIGDGIFCRPNVCNHICDKRAEIGGCGAIFHRLPYLLE